MDHVGLGVLLAFCAMLFWGVGDFLIQRSARRIGDWETLLVISALGIVIITPFVYQNLLQYTSLLQLSILILTSVIIFAAALVDFEALKKGKIAIVEPVYSIEIPIVMILSALVVGETLTINQVVLIITIIIGLILVSIKSNFMKSKALEKGVFLAAVSAILLGISSFLIGYGSRITSPLMINWFISVTLTVYCLVYLWYTGKLTKLAKDIKKSPLLIFAMCISDNLAWITYAFATVFIPITIALALSENYIAVAALLGLVVSKEKILLHQKVGLVVALAAAVMLALII